MPVPPPWEPEGGEAIVRVPATPFRFRATESVVVLAPATYDEIGRLDKNGGYTAIEVWGRWVLVEDGSGCRGWVPVRVVRTGRPVAASLLIPVVLGVTLVAGFRGIVCTPCYPNLAAGTALAIAALVVLVGGLWQVWRLFTGRGGRRARPGPLSPPPR
jgi:hypothetical protein